MANGYTQASSRWRLGQLGRQRRSAALLSSCSLTSFASTCHLSPVTCSSSSSSNGDQQASLWDSDASLADNLESNLTLVRTSSSCSCPSCPSCCRYLPCLLPPAMAACMCAHAPVCLSPLAAVGVPAAPRFG